MNKAIKRIFITSECDDQGPLATWAAEQKIELIAQSLIEIKPITFVLPESFDVTIFYSKNAVNHFISGLSPQQIEYVRSTEFVCIGPATALHATSRFNKTSSIDFSDFQDRPEELARLLSQKTCLIPQAANSRNTIEKVLTQSLLLPLVVYNNQIKDHITLPTELDLIILTSPLNAEALLNSEFNKETQFLAIGQTTAKFSKQNFGVEPIVAIYPNERGIVETIKSIQAESL